MTLQEKSVLPTRLSSLDNLRYLVVLGVIVFHSTSAYVGATYFVVDPHPGELTRALNRFLISFVMIVLFFVSGYFVLPSLEKKGVVRFIYSKLTRLGVPFVLGVMFLAPISTYLAYAAQDYRGLAAAGYWDFWVAYMSTIPAFPFAHIGARAFSAAMQFHYHHFWYVSVLLALCVVFALLWALKERVFGQRLVLVRSAAPSNAAVSLAIVVFAGLATLTNGVGRLLVAVPGMEPLLNVLGTSPWQLPAMSLWFAMGIYAYRKRWFVDGTYPGHLVGWVVVWLVVLFSDELGLRMSWYAVQGAVYIALLSGLAFRFLNRPSPIHASLAANSYPMFIIHYPIVVLLQLMLLGVGVPTWLKFLICATTAIGASWLISNYLIRRSPRGAVAALVALFAVMCLGLHPDAQASAAATPAEEQDFGQRPRDYAAFADSRLRWYDEQIGLTDEQKAALKPLLQTMLEAQFEADRQFSDTLETLLDEKQLKRFRQSRGR